MLEKLFQQIVFSSYQRVTRRRNGDVDHPLKPGSATKVRCYAGGMVKVAMLGEMNPERFRIGWTGTVLGEVLIDSVSRRPFEEKSNGVEVTPDRRGFYRIGGDGLFIPRPVRRQRQMPNRMFRGHRLVCGFKKKIEAWHVGYGPMGVGLRNPIFEDCDGALRFPGGSAAPRRSLN